MKFRCVAPGHTIATVAELRDHPTMKFRLARAETVAPGADEAFVVRVGERVYAWRNVCRHAAIPLDWTPNEFFDESGELLQCRTHGALYRPDTGECVGGPCAGRALHPVPIRVEPDGRIVLAEQH